MAYLTEQEFLVRFEYYTMQVERRLLEGENVKTVCDQVPFAVQLNDPETLGFVYANKKHAELAGHHIDKIREMGMDYLDKYIHPKSLSFISETLPPLYSQMSNHQTFAFIQHARVQREDNYSPVITFTKSTKLPRGLLVSLLPFPKDFGAMSPKMEQIVEMDRFKLKHFRRFQRLTGREVEVLRLLANGRNNPQIAEELFLSRATVETHRKNLKRKLGLRSFRDLMRYAFAFNLVEV